MAVSSDWEKSGRVQRMDLAAELPMQSYRIYFEKTVKHGRAVKSLCLNLASNEIILLIRNLPLY